jgi:serine phosphatase RsbU (regulator of sigma subunit)/pSer/pThr/pTyr-binding forkhead associated (FHA) protein
VSTLGRSIEASVRIPDSTVSRKHARIRKKVSGYFLEDMGSGNGTFLNNAKIRAETLLKSGDRIRLGQILLEFRGDDDTSAVKAGGPEVQILDSDTRSTSTVIKSIDARQKTLVQAARPAGEPSIAQAHQRLRTVLSISNSLQRILDVDTLLQRIATDLFSVFSQAERTLILLKDKHSPELSGRVARTRDGAVLQRMEVSRTILHEVVRTKSALLTADAMLDQRFMSGASVHNLRVRSMMCVPLLFEEDLVGAIYVDTTQAGRSFAADDLDLLTGIGSQAALAVQNASMHEHLLQRQRAERDLQFAHDVQKGFLPESPPQVPGYEFAAWYHAAQVVGGDFYDFVELSGNRLGIVLGDVSGKGVPAALLMAKLMSEVRYAASSASGPAEVVGRLNDGFVRRPTEGRFVTLVYLELDPAAHRIEIVNAGHPAGLIRRRAAGAVEKMSSGENFPLGIGTQVRYDSATCHLGPGDTVALFTDGVTDAMNGRGEPYGDQRLESVLRAHSVPPEQLLGKVLNDIDTHVGTVAPSDDLTMVCFGPSFDAKKAHGHKPG